MKENLKALSVEDVCNMSVEDVCNVFFLPDIGWANEAPSSDIVQRGARLIGDITEGASSSCPLNNRCKAEKEEEEEEGQT